MNPNEMQDPQAQFDVQRNPQDMQLMTDAMMYAPMLQKLDHEERKQAWPEIVSRLQKTSPKAAALDPSLPPSDEQLDELMSGYPEAKGAPAADTSRDAYLKAQVQRQIEGKPPISQAEWEKEQSQKTAAPTEAPASPGAQGSAMEGMMPAQGGDDAMIDAARQQAQQGMGMKAGFGSEEPKAPSGYKWLNDDPSTGKIVKIPEVDEQGNPIDKANQLTPAMKTKMQQQLKDSQDDYSRLSQITQNWDSDIFTLQGQAYQKWIQIKAATRNSTPEEDALLKKRLVMTQNLEVMRLMWQKYITGVAGSDKQMEDIKQTTLNRNLTPPEAEAARDLLIKNTIRDMTVAQRMLQRGMTPESANYSEEFERERQKVETETAKFIKDFKAANKDRNPSDTDALMYMKKKNYLK